MYSTFLSLSSPSSPSLCSLSSPSLLLLPFTSLISSLIPLFLPVTFLSLFSCSLYSFSPSLPTLFLFHNSFFLATVSISLFFLFFTFILPLSQLFSFYQFLVLSYLLSHLFLFSFSRVSILSLPCLPSCYLLRKPSPSAFLNPSLNSVLSLPFLTVFPFTPFHWNAITGEKLYRRILIFFCFGASQLISKFKCKAKGRSDIPIDKLKLSAVSEFVSLPLEDSRVNGF